MLKVEGVPRSVTVNYVLYVYIPQPWPKLSHIVHSHIAPGVLSILDYSEKPMPVVTTHGIHATATMPIRHESLCTCSCVNND